MPVWLLVAAVAIGVALILLYVSVVFGSPVAAGLGAIVAAVVVVVECTKATAATFNATAGIDHLDIAPPLAGTDPERRDPGYRSYLFGPVLRDYALAGGAAARRSWERAIAGGARPSLMRRIVDTWDASGDMIPDYGGVPKLFLFAPMVGALVGVAAGFTAAAVLAGLTTVVFGLLLALVLIGAVISVGLLRALEIILLRVRGITLECGNCHRRVGSPAYDCDNCEPGDRARHRRLVPGSLGVLSRTCRCGHVLPTLLVRGKWRLPAYCQHDGCNYPLPANGLTAPTFHVPVVAGRSAGKTVFMMASVADLDTTARTAGQTDGIEFADDNSRAEYMRAHTRLRDSDLDGIAATLPELPLRALNVYLGAQASRSRRLLYLYDAAGERYQTSDGIATFRFLGFTAGVVFVVDPFAIDVVRRTMDPAVLTTLRASDAEPADAAGRFTADLRANLGVRSSRRMNVGAAVVVTKCDALLTLGSVPHPYEELGAAAADPGERAARSGAVCAWLRNVAGEGGMIDELGNSFRRAEYFAVSALDAFTPESRPSTRSNVLIRNDDPSAPLHWLLERKDLA